jgi:2-phosphosulfolactate phosphatase
VSTENKKKIEVCFSPAIFKSFEDTEAIVIVVDVLRATTAICAAFMNGVEQIIPVATINEAREYKQKGFLVAAERDGIVLDFADFGNSPFNFTPDNVGGKTVVYSTTNGTQAIQLASKCFKVVVGAFSNITALSDWAVSENRDIIVLCAGWKNRFSLEDSLLAGAIAEKILEHANYYTICDSALAMVDLWQIAKTDLIGYIQKAAQRSRLRKNGLDDVIEFCHTPDITSIIPIYSKGVLINMNKLIPSC